MVVVLVFLSVVLGLVGWRGDWVVVYGGHTTSGRSRPGHMVSETQSKFSNLN